MASNIYFSNNSSKGFSWWVTRIITSLILSLPKKPMLYFGKKILLKPVRRKPGEIPSQMRLEEVTTPDGMVKLYSLGSGPVIFLSHGWSGSATQLFPLMERIAKSGYQAIAFDQLAHGLSSGNEANLFLFIKTKKQILNFIEKQHQIVAIISHSMAATAALNALNKPYPLLLIAPVFDFVNSLFQKVEASGVPIRLLTSVLRDLESRHNMQIAQIDPTAHLPYYPGEITIVHDQIDQFAPFVISENIVKKYPHIKLSKTKNLGHGRVISSDCTWDALQEMINPNDKLKPQQVGPI
ncbi:alpha/beta hydrolase [Aliikangiella sp. IMCC44359]|uniref:alpha/beta hydrolase n=1 Tax=Aliikangiella sp. IMCC44359 TaxID=3459125 RepID=UPI00403AA4A7